MENFITKKATQEIVEWLNMPFISQMANNFMGFSEYVNTNHPYRDFIRYMGLSGTKNGYGVKFTDLRLDYDTLNAVILSLVIKDEVAA